MGVVERMEERLGILDERMDAVIDVLNMLVEDVFEPEFVRKIDKLAAHGEEVTDRQAC